MLFVGLMAIYLLTAITLGLLPLGRSHRSAVVVMALVGMVALIPWQCSTAQGSSPVGGGHERTSCSTLLGVQSNSTHHLFNIGRFSVDLGIVATGLAVAAMILLPRMRNRPNRDAGRVNDAK